MPAARGGRGAASGTSRSGRGAATTGAPESAPRLGSGSPSCELLRRPPADFDALIVGYPGHFDLPAARARRAWTSGDLQPARLARGHLRRRPRALPTRLGRRTCACGASTGMRSEAADLVVADTRANADHLAELGGPAARAGRGCLRRRRGADLRPRLVAGGAVHRPVRRQADPAARPRDGARGRARGCPSCVSARRQRPARVARPRAAGERRVGPVGRVRAPPGRAPPRRLRARDLRHLDEGAARDPEQGVPGARVRDAARHRRHARRARAARRRRERAARSARRRGGARGRPAQARGETESWRSGSRPAAAPPTRHTRAKRCSAAAGASWSSRRSRAR